MCSDDSQCNLKGECDLDDGQCNCNPDWTASPDCSGTLPYLMCTLFEIQDLNFEYSLVLSVIQIKYNDLSRLM